MRKEWEEEEQEEKEQDPAFLFYSADFLVGVTDLSYEERGQYITLLCLQHQKGHLSARTMKDMRVSEAVMDKFLRDAKGRYYNKRLDKEKRRREAYAKSRSQNGSKGGRPRKNEETTEKAYAFHMESECKAYENHSENENVNIDSITLVEDSTEDMSLSDSTFSFSKTTTTTTTTTTVDDKNAHASKKNVENIEEERDEDGLTSRECAIILAFFDRETDDDIASSDLMLDFIAYNKSKEWRGIGGEDVRRDLKRYLRRWIEEERAKKSKYRRDT